MIMYQGSNAWFDALGFEKLSDRALNGVSPEKLLVSIDVKYSSSIFVSLLLSFDGGIPE